MLLISLLMACSGGSAPGPADCPDCPPCEQAGDALSPFEAGLLKDDLADLRKGIRPFNAEGFGVCEGKRTCDRFLGAEAGELPAGSDYIVQAELTVPKLGDGWQVEFAMECETQGKSGNSSTNKDAKTYSVSYSGAERGYSLRPLRTIPSPNSSGARSCTYSLTPLNPDGSRGEPMTGSFSTPMP
ncbi:MAG: hypothetical protein H6739_01190 [Alphaproteobacteria bacterium]|nr:hypothetical protein [Alphaproteobacteria bacterium]